MEDDKLNRKALKKMDAKFKALDKKMEKHFSHLRSPHEELATVLGADTEATVKVSVKRGSTEPEQETWTFVWKRGKIRGLQREFSSGEKRQYPSVRGKSKACELRFFHDLEEFGHKERIRLTIYNLDSVGGDIRVNTIAHEYEEEDNWHLSARVKLLLDE